MELQTIANNCYSKVPELYLPFSDPRYPNSCTQIVDEASSSISSDFRKSFQKVEVTQETEKLKLMSMISLVRMLHIINYNAKKKCIEHTNPQSFTDVFSNLSDAQEKYKIMLTPLYGCFRNNLKEMGLMNNDYSINFTALSEENKKILLQRCSQEINECENSLGNKSRKGKKQ